MASLMVEKISEAVVPGELVEVLLVLLGVVPDVVAKKINKNVNEKCKQKM